MHARNRSTSKDSEIKKRASSTSVERVNKKPRLTKSFHCGICLATFPNRADLFRHRVREHGNPTSDRDWPSPLPWVLADGTEDAEIQQEILDHKDFILRDHVFGESNSELNFPVSACILRPDFHLRDDVIKALQTVLQLHN